MHGRKFLITGGSGFIGSHLTDRLLAAGDSVTVLDNLSTGRLQNLDGAGHSERFRFVQGSVLDELMVDELTNQCDVVIHLAAAVGVKLIVDQPLRSFTTNVRGSEIVVEAAHRYRKRLLVASTSEIYGKNSSGPLVETSDRILGNPAISRWAYSTAKAVDEILAFAYHRERGLETTVLRFFNTVGPRQSPAYGMVIPSLIRQAIRNEPITIYGEGTQTRCFCHVSDVVTAITGLLDAPESIGEAFNIGSPYEISMLDLAARIRDLSQSASEIVKVPYEVAYGKGFEDMQRRVPDTTKLRTITGWEPTRSLDEILHETIAEARAESHAVH
jgi:UDP-glucose 4-epimerase